MNAQTWLHTNLVRLEKAVLCANCDVISEAPNCHCAACGSEALLDLHRLLGGTTDTSLPVSVAESKAATFRAMSVAA